MAAKLVPKGSCFPTTLRNGTLAVYVGSHVITREVPWVEGRYEYDTTSYGNNNLVAVFRNDENTAIFRTDGTYSLLMKDNTLIGFRRGIDLNLRDNISIMRKCSILENDRLFEVWLYLLPQTGQIIFDPTYEPGFLILDVNKQSTIRLMNDIKEQGTYFYPQFIQHDGMYIRCKEGTLTYVLEGEYYAPSTVEDIV